MSTIIIFVNAIIVMYSQLVRTSVSIFPINFLVYSQTKWTWRPQIFEKVKRRRYFFTPICNQWQSQKIVYLFWKGKYHCTAYLMSPARIAIYSFIFAFLIHLMVHINFANDRIRTADSRCWKRPLYQLHHYHFQNWQNFIVNMFLVLKDESKEREAGTRPLKTLCQSGKHRAKQNTHFIYA